MIDRSNFIGKEMWINSTGYYNDEILECGPSHCTGVTSTGSSFRFKSLKKYQMNLGCIDTRKREHVFLDIDTLRNYVCNKIKKDNIISDFYCLIFYDNTCFKQISILKAKHEEDQYDGSVKWTVDHYSITNPDIEKLLTFDGFKVFISASINKLITLAAEFMNIKDKDIVDTRDNLKNEAIIKYKNAINNEELTEVELAGYYLNTYGNDAFNAFKKVSPMFLKKSSKKILSILE